MPQYELTDTKKEILISGLDLLIASKQEAPQSFEKGVVLSQMFELKDALQRCRFTYND